MSSVITVVVTCQTFHSSPLAVAYSQERTEAEKHPPDGETQPWALHGQNTAIFQATSPFSAKYSGPYSLDKSGEVKETVSADLIAGVRAWSGSEVFIDALSWQGFGLSNARGVEAFPNGEAFRLGTDAPHVAVCRAFLRQTFELGGEEEVIPGDQLTLAGRREHNRLTLTLGKVSAKDIFDNNAYANNPRTQFLSWGLMANEGWDYPADSLGYTEGGAGELVLHRWSYRYGSFRMPKVSNGRKLDTHLGSAWGMVGEIERKHELNDHPGSIRLLTYLNRAHMGSYRVAAEAATSDHDADIAETRRYRYKRGLGLNLEQEVTSQIGVFSRLGWGDGRNEAWSFSDTDYAGSVGLSVKGGAWGRSSDIVGLADVLSGLSPTHRRFFAAGGTGILAGDGTLSYAMENLLEFYYDAPLLGFIRGAIDYQLINNPACNSDRGPVSVFQFRIHTEL